MYQIGWRAIAFGAFLAVSAPLTVRILLSPVALLLISPLILVALLVLFLTSNIIVAWLLQRFRNRSPTQNNLRNAAKPLAFTTPAAWQALLVKSQWSADAKAKRPPLLPTSPEISDQLEELLGYIMRDFVLAWYRNISSSPAFPVALESTIHTALGILSNRVELLDLPALVVHRLLPKITAHVEKFRQSETAFRVAGVERHLTQSEELDMLMAGRYAGKDGKLHPAVENLASSATKVTEQAHLRVIVEKIMPYVLPEKDMKSKAVGVVAREIVACSVLAPIMEMLTDPDFWNRTIDQAAGAAIRQQKLVSKVRHMLDAQSGASPRSAVPGPRRMENITSRTAARQFDSFIQSINRCDSLLDARRLKNDVVAEIRRTRILLANHENEEWINGEKAADVVAFLDRLYNAKRHVESRIVSLGGIDDDTGSRRSVIHVSDESPSLTLRDILSNPNTLSYYMEFMDRRTKSLPIQFWLTVETFKDPLEDVDSDSDIDVGDDEDGLGLPSLPSASATIRGDMQMIDELYFSNPTSLSRLPAISQKYIDAVRNYVHDDAAPPSAARDKRVRRSVLLAQRQVERAMEEDYQDFQRSELWFKVLADVSPGKRTAENGAAATSPRSPVSPGDSTIRSVDALKPTISHRPQIILPPRIMTRTDSALAITASIGSLPSIPPMTTSPSFLLADGGSVGNLTPKESSSSNLAFLISPGNEAPRAPLFGDEDGDEEDGGVQQETIEALQAALTDIIADENASSLRPRALSTGSEDPLSRSGSHRPGKLHRRSSSQVFEDEDEERDSSPSHQAETPGSVHIAAPGDLNLSYEIDRLGEKINRLQAQESILDALTRKAELTGDAQELKVLRRSKESMERELRELTFQRSQYEQQESENRLVPERTKILISSSGLTGESAGKQVVRYFVEVQQLAPDGTFASGWIVARRYNEFWNMHQRLRERFAVVKNLEFPPKKLVTSLSSSFVDTRRTGLEKYMQALVKIPLVCESVELRTFLSRTATFPMSPEPSKPTPSLSGLLPAQGLVRNVYRSVTESIDDMFFGPSMLDVMMQRLSKQAAEFAGIVGSGVNDEELIEQALKAKSRSQSGDAGRVVPPEETLLRLSTGDLKPLEDESGMSSFTAPICDLILAVFELDKKNNWLRKQAVVIILQQVLGGTIERKLKEMAKYYLDEPHLMQYINMFKDIMWPGGYLKEQGPPRTAEEKLRTREEANRKLSTLMPDVAANMIGRSNARHGARRIFAVLQNRRLNQHLVYTIMDEVAAALFPEANLL